MRSQTMVGGQLGSGKSCPACTKSPACNFSTLHYIGFACRRLRRNLAAALSAPLSFSCCMAPRRDTPFCGRLFVRKELVGEERAHDGRRQDRRDPVRRTLRLTLDNEHRIIVCTASKMRRYQIRSVVGDHVHVEMTPYDLTQGLDRLSRTDARPGAKRGPAAGDQALTRFHKDGGNGPPTRKR